MHHLLLPSERNKRCGALHPGPINLRLIPSGDSFRRQPLLQPYVPRGLQAAAAAAAAAAASTRHTAPCFLSYRYRVVSPPVVAPVCQPPLACQGVCVCVCVCLPGLRLSPAGRENPGPCVSPVGRRFWTAFGFCRRADPDRQSDDGRPLLFGRPCRRGLRRLRTVVVCLQRVNVCRVCAPSSAALAYYPRMHA